MEKPIANIYSRGARRDFASANERVYSTTAAVVVGARARARYQKREESWVLARGRLPAAYQTLFRSAVRFGDSIVDTRNCAHSERGPVILHDSPFCPPLSTLPPRPPATVR